jgi:hypothetical protein
MRGGWRRDDGGRPWRGGFGGGLSLFALEDGFERVAGLGDLGEVEPGRRFHAGPGRRGGAAATMDVAAHLLGFILFDGTGVRLFLGDADRCQRVQNGLALDFQFPCQIVDSNFAHPSLFRFPAPLAVHISLIEVEVVVVCIIPETRHPRTGE